MANYQIQKDEILSITSGILSEALTATAKPAYETGVEEGVTATKKGTAVASQVLSGQTFTNSSVVEGTGTMPNKGAVSSTLPLGGSYVSTEGYYSSININAASATGNAVASEVLANRTFTNSSNTSLTGSMPNKGSVSSTLGYGQSYTGTAGYYSSINITASNVAGTAQASDVLSNKTFINSSGSLKTGSMTNRGSVSSTLPLGGSYSGSAGYYSGINISAANATGNATASDVLSGKTFTNSVGSASGSMTNKGAVSSTIQPGSSYSGGAGYYSGINITAAAATNSNTGTTVLSDNINSTTYQSFSSGDTDFDMGLTNAIRYIDGSGISNGIRVAHTPTYNDGGKKISNNYGNNVAWTKVLSIPGASSLKVFYHCQTESTNYDWGCIWQGNYPSYTANNNYGSSVTGKLGGSTAVNSSITITGSVCTVAFKSDTSSDSFDGLYVLAMDASLADTLPIGGGGGGATPVASVITLSALGNLSIQYTDVAYSTLTVQASPGVIETVTNGTVITE